MYQILKKTKQTEPRKSKVWLVLELPLCSFVSLEPAWVIADDRVAGDLYNPVQSRGWMAAGRQAGRQEREREKIQSVSLIEESSGSYCLMCWWVDYLEGAIKLPRLSPILRLSEKFLSWELDPPCCRSNTTCRPELKGCRGGGGGKNLLVVKPLKYLLMQR